MLGFQDPLLSRYFLGSPVVTERRGTARSSMRLGWLRMGLMMGCSMMLFVSHGRGQETKLPSAEPRRLPGMQAGGMMLLPTQWSLKPAGKQLPVGDFPTTLTFHPSGDFLAILHAGYGEHEVVIVDTQSFKMVSRSPIPVAFVGLCFAPDGSHLYCSGAEKEVVHRFRFAEGYLSEHRELRITDIDKKQVPAGLSISPDGKTLFVACGWGHTVCRLPLEPPQTPVFIPMQPDDYPYLAIPSNDGRRLFVSLWGGAAVAVVDLERDRVLHRWPTQPNPTELILSKDGKHLFVACANSNTVCVLETETGKTLEVITTALFPTADNGSTPNSISLSADERVLLVANATNNNVAVIDVGDRGHSRSLGFIPVGWYPTSARFHPQDGTVWVANGKGLASKANRQGPQPLNPPPKTIEEYIGGLFQGTIARIEPPTPDELARYTRTAFACSPLREDKKPVETPREPNHPIPSQVGEPSPIKYCLYIVKENRTYDQVFGDLPQGNGDPSLCIFPAAVTPNHHALAEEFVLLDNFYVESEVSADGHEWSMAAYATDFVEKTWPLTYRGSREGKLKYPAEGNFDVARPSSGYLWDRARQANVSYRSYGEFVNNGPVGQPATARLPALEGHIDPDFRGYDLNYRDQQRADRFIAELKRFEQEGEMPRLQIIRLPNDHTYGTSVGKPTPTAMVADNDLALGRLVEAVSRSRFWKETAIFVVEDDAQNGSDHVDAHRTVALVISPYTKRRFVDSRLYSTSSMLRTMELILGMEPMTQFDGAALPMYHSFTAVPDFTPYQHRPANVDLDAVNQPTAWGSKLSESFDFSKEDAADDLLLNEVVWRSVRGPDHPMPPPVRAGFVFAGGEEEDEEEEEDDEDEDDKDESKDGNNPPATH